MDYPPIFAILFVWFTASPLAAMAAGFVIGRYRDRRGER